ncbi:MAG TPA: peptide chain release factor aRF-1 [Nitrososphaerales archaeon]|nr:peptide chain release factor aRF-1 [Nitrososphaerales archaeon]
MSTKADSVRLYKVRKLISELSNKEGRGTELVSLYIPPKKPVHEAIANLREEWGTAGNIKSDTTRNHVQDALTKTMQRLKLYRTAPDTGLVIFAGALPTNGPGSEVVNVYEIIPPKPVVQYLYQCDDHFHVEWLKDMLKEDKVYGLLSIDASDTGLGILSGDSLEIVDVMTSGVSGKTRKGGQSARRYERGREMELTYYYHRVAEHATRAFIDSNKVTGMIVGGPGPTKDEFLKGGFLHYELQKKIVAVLDLGYSGREGVRELVEKAGDILKDVRLVEEKKLVQKFLFEVNKQGGLAVYGLPRVIEALQKASTEVVLVSDDLDMVKLEARCKKCGTVKSETVQASKRIHQRQEMASVPCTKCGATDFEVTEKDIVDVLEEMAFQVGSKVEVISTGTEEGSMFKSFGGVGAILRYRS